MEYLATGGCYKPCRSALEAYKSAIGGHSFESRGTMLLHNGYTKPKEMLVAHKYRHRPVECTAASWLSRQTHDSVGILRISQTDLAYLGADWFWSIA